MEGSGQFDKEGNRLVKNLDSNGRFHTDWLNMMYPRLRLAKDLLTDDGVLFVSIDDNEQENLKKICCDIFGESNFVAQCIRRTINSGKHDTQTIAVYHEYSVVFAKDINNAFFNKKPKSENERDRLYPERDEHEKVRGRFYVSQLNKNSIQYSDSLNFPITGPDGVDIFPGEGFEDKEWCWRWGKDKVKWGLENDYLVFKQQGDKYKVYAKSYEFRDNNGNPIERTNPYSTLEFVAKEYGNFNATPELSKIFNGKKYFDFPKSVVFVKELLKLANSNDSIILDFFSGSATTAHAVMQLNAEDGGNRKFIMVQLPEKTDENSEAYKAGYENICEIGKERIRRAGEKIKAEFGIKYNSEFGMRNAELTEDNYELRIKHSELDTGFRVLKLDSSNMKDVYYNPDAYEPDLFESLADNIKEDRSPEDLLFQVMLDLGVSLSSRITIRNADFGMRSFSYFDVAEGFLIACFDKDVNEEVIKEIAQKKPFYFVMRDSSMANDSVATNFEQIFATYSPDTVRKIL